MSEKIWIAQPNTGTLFKNNKKTKDTHPGYKGSLKVGQEEYWLSGWVKVSKKGEKYFSLALTPKKPVYAPKEEVKMEEEKPFDEDFEDDIPF